MKAACYSRYGPPEVVEIRDVAKPVPRDHEVLVRVQATTVTAGDRRMRAAKPVVVRLITGLRGPKRPILGMEFAGTVEATGKAVERFQPGDVVFGGTGFSFGTHAEYVCAAEDKSALKPVNCTIEESAAIMFGGMTALDFLRRGGIAAGQKVLIDGASGSVGVFAVQLAKHFGAHVTAVCSTANVDLVSALGADEVVDYTRGDFTARRPRLRYRVRHRGQERV